MPLRDLPIQRKIMRALLLTTGAVLGVTCATFFAYDFFTFRHTTIQQIGTLGRVIASNSTAALAFKNQNDAAEILSALKAEPHIVAAVLYDAEGNLFSYYPATADTSGIARVPEDHPEGYYLAKSHLMGYQPVVLDNRRLGTLSLTSDITVIYERLALYTLIALLVTGLSLAVAYLLSRRLQAQIATPILKLAETARAISDRKDYSVRATKVSADETGLLTDAFNQMLARIEEQTKEITSFNQKLEERVVERTRELQIANKELEAFSYSVSHDLRSPLRSIHGYMNIFSQEYSHQLDDEGKRLVNIIMASGLRMGHLIDDLLSFSQLGRKELRKRKISMMDLASEAWAEQAEYETGRKINFILHEIPPAIGDATTVKQVWTNLISNACKYSGYIETATVEVGAFRRGETVVYYVKDNGAGFEMKYYHKLFGVFQRLHSEEEFKGTGVGLAIVKRVVSKHGGVVWAEAKLNEGATFYFTLTPTNIPSHIPPVPDSPLL